MTFSSKLTGAASCLAFCLLGASASAATLTGTFTTDDQLAQYTWNLAQPSNIVAYTDSYASGGFVPVISLFDGTSGAFIASDGGDVSCSGGRMMDGTTGICNDAYLSTSLAKGSYTVVLSEFFNFPKGSNLSDGFTENGAGNFTSSVCSATGAFYETDLAPCVQRTGNYSLNLTSTSTPEPSTGWLALPALALAAYRFRRLKSRT
ncbi:MAG: DVUA0089 family protein [Acidobacteriota bacterium]|nr:DVUA0089 family protein [Acidobacteriota bacterium]